MNKRGKNNINRKNNGRKNIPKITIAMVRAVTII
jgi:hypothetical protein